MKITKNGIGGVAMAETDTLRYNSLNDDEITDVVAGRTLWRKESINPMDVADRFAVSDEQWKAVLDFRSEIKNINSQAKKDRLEKIRIENEKHAAPVRGVGWCNKCHSYCYGDCEA